jgi:hypothetical protein
VPEDITLRSPRLWNSFYDGYMTVPEGTVYRAIDALRISVAQWSTFVGDEEADEASRAQVADAAQPLAELMTAMANHARQGGLGELVRQIATFMDHDPHAREYLDALRGRLQQTRDVLRHQDHLIEQARLGVRQPYRASYGKAQRAVIDREVEAIDEDLEILDALIALDAHHCPHCPPQEGGQR